jgi:hypothetical protein
MYDDLVLRPASQSWLARDWNKFVADCLTPTVSSAPRKAWFATAWLFIAAVSVYDGLLVEAYKVCILQVEWNPIAWYMIKHSGNDVTSFLCAKALSTALVLWILTMLYRRAPRLAYPVINSVATFQGALLVFLNFA